jgi:type I restriction enzyme, S subunit
MSKLEIFTINPSDLSSVNFNPRNYDPYFILIQKKLNSQPTLQSILIDNVTGGSPPPPWFFKKKYESGIPFVKTSAIRHDFININDLHFIDSRVHHKENKRSITKSYHVIFSMTGKFMGKAALCPPTIPELNMSQNSVVLKCKSKEEAAFLCIFMNSKINKTQIKGLYSITKQKYINQGKIKELKILEYEKQHEKLIAIYLTNIQNYYNSLNEINSTLEEFNQYFKIKDSIFDESFDFKTKFASIDKTILAVPYYRKDFQKVISKITRDKDSKTLKEMIIKKGDEIGSINYLSEGIPFIKTSDLQNYTVDYSPDNYCSNRVYDQVDQNLHVGDILFTKDGKMGQVGIIEESSKIVISGGLVSITPKSDDERYWLFLLLASNYGKMFFSRWTVIASTMAHLRKEFFTEFIIPVIDKKFKNKLISQLKENFKIKKDAFNEIEKSKEKILNLMDQKIGIN